MYIVSKYVQKFMSESKVDPIVKELDKIRDLIDLDEGSEFLISVEFEGETNRSVDPETGSYHSTEVKESVDGYLSIENTDGKWSWRSSVFSENYSLDFDLNDQGEGFSSLEECLASIESWADTFTEFEVNGLA